MKQKINSGGGGGGGGLLITYLNPGEAFAGHNAKTNNVADLFGDRYALPNNSINIKKTPWYLKLIAKIYIFWKPAYNEVKTIPETVRKKY